MPINDPLSPKGYQYRPPLMPKGNYTQGAAMKNAVGAGIRRNVGISIAPAASGPILGLSCKGVIGWVAMKLRPSDPAIAKPVSVPMEIIRKDGSAKEAAQSMKYAMAMQYAYSPTRGSQQLNSHDFAQLAAKNAGKAQDGFDANLREQDRVGSNAWNSEARANNKMLKKRKEDLAYWMPLADFSAKAEKTGQFTWDIRPASAYDMSFDESTKMGQEIIAKLLKNENFAKHFDEETSTYTNPKTGNKISILVDHGDLGKPQIIIAHAGTESGTKYATAQNADNVMNYGSVFGATQVPPSIEETIDVCALIRHEVAEYNKNNGADVDVVSVGHSLGGLKAQAEALANGGRAICGNSEAMGSAIARRVGILYSNKKPEGTQIDHVSIKRDWASNSKIANVLGAVWEFITSKRMPRNVGKGVEFDIPKGKRHLNRHADMPSILALNGMAAFSEEKPAGVKHQPKMGVGDGGFQELDLDDAYFSQFRKPQPAAQPTLPKGAISAKALKMMGASGPSVAPHNAGGRSNMGIEEQSQSSYQDELDAHNARRADDDDMMIQRGKSLGDPFDDYEKDFDDDDGGSIGSDDIEEEDNDVPELDPLAGGNVRKHSAAGDINAADDGGDDDLVLAAQDDDDDLEDLFDEEELQEIDGQYGVQHRRKNTDQVIADELWQIESRQKIQTLDPSRVKGDWEKRPALQDQDAPVLETDMMADRTFVAGQAQELALQELDQAVQKLTNSTESIEDLALGDLLNDNVPNQQGWLSSIGGRKEQFDAVRGALGGFSALDQRSLAGLMTACDKFIKKRGDADQLYNPTTNLADLKRSLQRTDPPITSRRKKLLVAGFLRHHTSQILQARQTIKTNMFATSQKPANQMQPQEIERLKIMQGLMTHPNFQANPANPPETDQQMRTIMDNVRERLRQL
ncbi:MAG: hypothetical protein GY947_14990 [Rhodobacteraceae bacterium]|nr:hypothetical protein [Paracoccaceae bacterium]